MNEDAFRKLVDKDYADNFMTGRIYEPTREELNKLSQTEAVKMENVTEQKEMVSLSVNELEAKLVSFGNYLLSQERADMISEENKNQVTHADLANWEESQQFNAKAEYQIFPEGMVCQKCGEYNPLETLEEEKI